MAEKTFLYQIFLTFHFIGLAFGLGGAVISDMSFFRSLRVGDRVTVETVRWMRSFSLVVWSGISLLTLSGAGLFLLQPNTYLHSAGFIAKMVFVAVLIINGLFLNFYTTARLTTFNFSDTYQQRGPAWRARKLSFVFGGISTVTWGSTLLIAMFRSLLTWTLSQYLIVYGGLVLLALCGSLALERLLHQYFTLKLTTADPEKLPISTLTAVQRAMIVQKYAALKPVQVPLVVADQAVSDPPVNIPS